MGMHKADGVIVVQQQTRHYDILNPHSVQLPRSTMASAIIHLWIQTIPYRQSIHVVW